MLFLAASGDWLPALSRARDGRSSERSGDPWSGEAGG